MKYLVLFALTLTLSASSAFECSQTCNQQCDNVFAECGQQQQQEFDCRESLAACKDECEEVCQCLSQCQSDCSVSKPPCNEPFQPSSCQDIHQAWCSTIACPAQCSLSSTELISPGQRISPPVFVKPSNRFTNSFPNLVRLLTSLTNLISRFNHPEKSRTFPFRRFRNSAISLTNPIRSITDPSSSLTNPNNFFANPNNPFGNSANLFQNPAGAIINPYWTSSSPNNIENPTGTFQNSDSENTNPAIWANNPTNPSSEIQNPAYSKLSFIKRLIRKLVTSFATLFAIHSRLVSAYFQLETKPSSQFPNPLTNFANLFGINPEQASAYANPNSQFSNPTGSQTGYSNSGTNPYEKNLATFGTKPSDLSAAATDVNNSQIETVDSLSKSPVPDIYSVNATTQASRVDNSALMLIVLTLTLSSTTALNCDIACSSTCDLYFSWCGVSPLLSPWCLSLRATCKNNCARFCGCHNNCEKTCTKSIWAVNSSPLMKLVYNIKESICRINVCSIKCFKYSSITFASDLFNLSTSLAPPATGNLNTPTSLAPPGSGNVNPPTSLAPPGSGNVNPPTSLAPPGSGNLNHPTKISNSAFPTTNPTIPTTNPTIPTTNPTIPTTNPTIPTTNPRIPSSKSTDKSSNANDLDDVLKNLIQGLNNANPKPTTKAADSNSLRSSLNNLLGKRNNLLSKPSSSIRSYESAFSDLNSLGSSLESLMPRSTRDSLPKKSDAAKSPTKRSTGFLQDLINRREASVYEGDHDGKSKFLDDLIERE